MVEFASKPAYGRQQLKTIETEWRDYRNLSEPQRLALDMLTNQGIFAANPKKTPHVFYGGAAWGGKSYWLRSAAFELNLVLRNLGFPNRWGVIYCDTYPNLVDRHITKFIEEFGGIGEYKDTQTRGPHVRFYGEGMGGVYLRNLGDNSRRGSEFDWLLGEEITEWMRKWLSQALYTARSGDDLPFAARGFNSNPDGPGHGWVKEIFVPEFRNLEERYVKAVGADQFFYVPALKEDNPMYEKQGHVVEANLASIEDDDVRLSRSTGDWNLYRSGRFPKFKESIHTFDWQELFDLFGIPQMDPEQFLRECEHYGFDIYGSLDYATSVDSVSAYYLHLVDPSGRPWTFFALRMIGKELEEQATEILNAEKGMTIRLRYADPQIRTKAAERQDGKTRQERFQEEGVYFELAVNDRVEGAQTIASLLFFVAEDGHMVRAPSWRILRKQANSRFGCPDLIKMIPNLARDKGNPEDVAKNDGANHDYDSCRYFLHTRYRGPGMPAALIVEYSAAWYRQLAENNRPKKKQDQW